MFYHFKQSSDKHNLTNILCLDNRTSVLAVFASVEGHQRQLELKHGGGWNTPLNKPRSLCWCRWVKVLHQDVFDHLRHGSEMILHLLQLCDLLVEQVQLVHEVLGTLGRGIVWGKRLEQSTVLKT